MDKRDFDAIKAQLKEKKLSQASIARRLGKSAGWIGQILNGHYPSWYASEKGTAILPVYLERFFEQWRITWPSKPNLSE